METQLIIAIVAAGLYFGGSAIGHGLKKTGHAIVNVVKRAK